MLYCITTNNKLIHINLQIIQVANGFLDYFEKKGKTYYKRESLTPAFVLTNCLSNRLVGSKTKSNVRETFV